MALFKIFKRSANPEAPLIQTLNKIVGMNDPDNKHFGCWAKRQGTSDYWDVYKSSRERGDLSFRDDIERVVSGVGIREAIDMLETLEKPWGSKVRGLDKPQNYYALLRPLLPPPTAEEIAAMPETQKLLHQSEALRQERTGENATPEKIAADANDADRLTSKAVAGNEQRLKL